MMHQKTPSVVVANHHTGHWVAYVNQELSLMTSRSEDSAYCRMHEAATAIAEKLGCHVQTLYVPDIDDLNREADNIGEQMLPVLERMGAFEPEGSIFWAITSADLIDIENVYTTDRLADGWLNEIRNMRNTAIWFPDMPRTDFNGYAVTFDELCRARYQGAGVWRIPYGNAPSGKEKILEVKFFNLKPYQD